MILLINLNLNHKKELKEETTHTIFRIIFQKMLVLFNVSIIMKHKIMQYKLNSLVILLLRFKKN